jgi:hypothetical protein
MPCSGILGSVKCQSGFALYGILLHHILPALVLLRKPLYGLAKRRQPRTLCEIKPENIQLLKRRQPWRLEKIE